MHAKRRNVPKGLALTLLRVALAPDGANATLGDASGYEYVAEIHTILKYLNLLDFQRAHPCHAWAFRLGVVTNCAQDKRRAWARIRRLTRPKTIKTRSWRANGN